MSSVKVKRTASGSSEDLFNSKTKSRPLGVRHLPEELKDTLTKVFAPCYIEYIGKSDDPWASPCISVMQQIFDEVYPEHSCALTKGSAPYDVVSTMSITFGKPTLLIFCHRRGGEHPTGALRPEG